MAAAGVNISPDTTHASPMVSSLLPPSGQAVAALQKMIVLNACSGAIYEAKEQ